jgi:hypothetical protein
VSVLLLLLLVVGLEGALLVLSLLCGGVEVMRCDWPVGYCCGCAVVQSTPCLLLLQLLLALCMQPASLLLLWLQQRHCFHQQMTAGPCCWQMA